MPGRKLAFEAADIEQLYRGGFPSSWEELLKRSQKAAFHRRRRISDPEADEITYGLRLLHERGGDIPGTPRELYLQLVEVLSGIPTPGAYPA